jgi:hypothetical protein
LPIGVVECRHRDQHVGPGVRGETRARQGGMASTRERAGLGAKQAVEVSLNRLGGSDCGRCCKHYVGVSMLTADSPFGPGVPRAILGRIERVHVFRLSEPGRGVRLQLTGSIDEWLQSRVKTAAATAPTRDEERHYSFLTG